MGAPADIVILSNGPGELSTWVKPVVRELRQLFPAPTPLRVSVILSPCPHATGGEAQVAAAYPEVDRVQAAADFFPFLLWGRTAEHWDWHDQGVVLFLGGDQVYPVLVGKRLGYRTVVYAEWEARWHRWVDRFGVMQPEAMAHVAPQQTHKFSVVGDLMAEAGQVTPQGKAAIAQRLNLDSETELIGLLPGSKPVKLAGLPLVLAIAEQIHATRPQTQFVIPVAPGLSLSTLAQFADPARNPSLSLMSGSTATLIIPDVDSGVNPDINRNKELPYLKTQASLKVFLWTQTPAHDLLAQCQLCLTTIGANTAELGALAIPMVVLLPTQRLENMRAWDGIWGLLANLPGVGTGLAIAMNWVVAQYLECKGKLLAWPNIWAGREVIPELLGDLEPQDVADLVLDWLAHPDKLAAIRQELRQVRGEPGAAKKLAKLVQAELQATQQGT